MIQVHIKKNGQITNGSPFETQEQADAWLARHEGMGTFGQKAQDIEIQVEVTPVVLETQELLDENGVSFDPPQFHEVEISPAQYETQTQHIDGYEVEFLDTSSQLAQEATNNAALKYLASTDWYVTRFSENGTAIPSEVTSARDSARLSIVR